MNVNDLELELRKLPGVRAAGFTERDDVLLIQLQVSGESPPSNLPLQATRIAYRHSDKPVALEVVRWRVAPAARDQVPLAAPQAGGALETMAGVEAAPGEIDGSATADAGVPDVVEESETLGATFLQPGPVPPPATHVEEDARGRVRLLAVLTFPDTDELEVHLTFQGRRVIGRSIASRGIIAVVEAMVDGLKMFAPKLAFTPSWARVLNDERGHDAHLVACELIAPDESRRLGIASGASAIEAAARAALHALNRALSHYLADDVADSDDVTLPADSEFLSDSD
jgi:hypothetical protein